MLQARKTEKDDTKPKKNETKTLAVVSSEFFQRMHHNVDTVLIVELQKLRDQE